MEQYLDEASQEGSIVRKQVGDAYDSILQLLDKYPDQYNKEARRCLFHIVSSVVGEYRSA